MTEEEKKIAEAIRRRVKPLVQCFCKRKDEE